MNSFATTMATPLTLLSALLMPSSTTVNNTTNNAARRRAAASRSGSVYTTHFATLACSLLVFVLVVPFGASAQGSRGARTETENPVPVTRPRPRNETSVTEVQRNAGTPAARGGRAGLGVVPRTEDVQVASRPEGIMSRTDVLVPVQRGSGTNDDVARNVGCKERSEKCGDTATCCDDLTCDTDRTSSDVPKSKVCKDWCDVKYPNDDVAYYNRIKRLLWKFPNTRDEICECECDPEKYDTCCGNPGCGPFDCDSGQECPSLPYEPKYPDPRFDEDGEDRCKEKQFQHTKQCFCVDSPRHGCCCSLTQHSSGCDSCVPSGHLLNKAPGPEGTWIQQPDSPMLICRTTCPDDVEGMHIYGQLINEDEETIGVLDATWCKGCDPYSYAKHKQCTETVVFKNEQDDSCRGENPYQYWTGYPIAADGFPGGTLGTWTIPFDSKGKMCIFPVLLKKDGDMNSHGQSGPFGANAKSNACGFSSWISFGRSVDNECNNKFEDPGHCDINADMLCGPDCGADCVAESGLATAESLCSSTKKCCPPLKCKKVGESQRCVTCQTEAGTGAGTNGYCETTNGYHGCCVDDDIDAEYKCVGSAGSKQCLTCQLNKDGPCERSMGFNNCCPTAEGKPENRCVYDGKVDHKVCKPCQEVADGDCKASEGFSGCCDKDFRCKTGGCCNYKGICTVDDDDCCDRTRCRPSVVPDVLKCTPCDWQMCDLTKADDPDECCDRFVCVPKTVHGKKKDMPLCAPCAMENQACETKPCCTGLTCNSETSKCEPTCPVECEDTLECCPPHVCRMPAADDMQKKCLECVTLTSAENENGGECWHDTDCCYGGCCDHCGYKGDVYPGFGTGGARCVCLPEYNPETPFSHGSGTPGIYFPSELCDDDMDCCTGLVCDPESSRCVVPLPGGTCNTETAWSFSGATTTDEQPSTSPSECTASKYFKNNSPTGPPNPTAPNCAFLCDMNGKWGWQMEIGMLDLPVTAAFFTAWAGGGGNNIDTAGLPAATGTLTVSQADSQAAEVIVTITKFVLLTTGGCAAAFVVKDNNLKWGASTATCCCKVMGGEQCGPWECGSPVGKGLTPPNKFDTITAPANGANVIGQTTTVKMADGVTPVTSLPDTVYVTMHFDISFTGACGETSCDSESGVPDP